MFRQPCDLHCSLLLQGLTVIDTTDGIVRIHQEPLKKKARMIKANRAPSIVNIGAHSVYDKDQNPTPATSGPVNPSSPNHRSNFIQHYDPGSQLAFGGFPWSHDSANEDIQAARAGNGE